jgi:hypothetical protein
VDHGRLEKVDNAPEHDIEWKFEKQAVAFDPDNNNAITP